MPTRRPPAAPAAPPGLVGAWAFDEGSGRDDRPTRRGTGTPARSTARRGRPQGRYGNALSVQRHSTTVRVPGSASLNVTTAMTLSAWIRPTAAQGGWRTIMQREADAYFLNASNDTGALLPVGRRHVRPATRLGQRPDRRAR